MNCDIIKKIFLHWCLHKYNGSDRIYFMWCMKEVNLII